MNDTQKAYDWIANIIDSCTNKFHFDAADRLIDLFCEKYNEAEDMQTKLKKLRQKHWNLINPILV